MSEATQTEGEILYDISYMHNLKRNYTNELIYKKERVNLWLPVREEWGEGIIREFGVEMYTLLYLKWITNKVLLHSIWNFAHCYMAAWMRGEFEGEWIHVYVWLPPFAVHLKLSHITNRLYCNII